MKCPRCQQGHQSSVKFCPECGTPVIKAVPIAKSYAELKDEVDRVKRSLSEALEQQTATSEILRVISGSPTDTQPVFDTIVQSAVRLCNGFFGNVLRYDGHVVSMAAEHHFRGAGLALLCH